MAIWHVTKGTDPAGWELYTRHYTFNKNAPHWTYKFTPVGETLVLMNESNNAVFAWVYNKAPRFDNITGVVCTLFRNESVTLSSEMILEACDLAWDKWPSLDLYTYVNPRRIRSRNPGYCFLMAGFRRLPVVSKVNKLVLLKRDYDLR